MQRPPGTSSVDWAVSGLSSRSQNSLIWNRNFERITETVLDMDRFAFKLPAYHRNHLNHTRYKLITIRRTCDLHTISDTGLWACRSLLMRHGL